MFTTTKTNVASLTFVHIHLDAQCICYLYA